MDSSLIINSTDTTGKKLQKSITNLNPNITNATAKEFAQKLNALTTNTYNGATRINKIDVDEDDEGGGLTPTPTTSKRIPTLTLPYRRYDTDNSGSPDVYAPITYDGDGVVKTTKGTIRGSQLVLSDGENGTGVIYAEETENCAAAVFEFECYYD